MLSSPPHPPRPSHTSPISFERPSSQATILPPSSPGAKRPSLSTTMHWLSRSPNQNSTQSSSNPYAAPKPVRISEPKFVRGMDSLTQQRTGVLGAGATVVRTPDDALREIASRPSLESKPSEDRSQKSPSPKSKKRKPSISKTMTPPSLESVGAALYSPPLPPLPFPESDEEVMLSRSSSGSSKPRTPKLPAATATGPVPVPVPRSPSLRPSLKIRSVPSSEDREVVPPLPSSVPPSPPPVFKPILVSDLPAFPVDPETIIVTLETCTTTYRTTLETINSRPSHLSKYVNTLVARQRASSAASSLYSNDEESDDLAVYRRHLASQGLLPNTSCNIHLFLDRPSAPYAHILSYLRSSPGTPENPEVIPRAVLYQSSSQTARLESLIELRDEAAYLNLENLHKMCLDEMVRMRHAPKMHARGNSSGGPSPMSMAQSLRASVYTLHTLLERVETDVRSSAHSLSVPELRPKDYKEKDNAMSDPPPLRSPPTPPSWEGPAHRRNGSLPRPLKPNPPPGWI